MSGRGTGLPDGSGKGSTSRSVKRALVTDGHAASTPLVV